MADEAQVTPEVAPEVVPPAAVEPAAVPAPLTINVTVIERGTLGPAGIEAVGSTHDITPEKFSDVWMRPTTKADATKLAKWKASQS